ncbi:MAG: HAMP domain-containing protein [Ktedonobacteraceae bacterium]|nr:HAMP domain-containing protein [Ktedonobacteraceae bacterium]
MFKFITNIQISRRLLLAFLLAAVIPGIVISLLGFAFIGEQNARSRAVQTNIHASKSASTMNSYLLSMNMLLNALYQKLYKNGQNSTPAQIQESTTQLQNQENNFDTAIQNFEQEYQITTAPNMRSVYSTLMSNNSKTPLPDQQQDALNQVNASWSIYKDEQVRVREAIARKAPGEQVRTLLLKANTDCIQLEIAWNRVSTISEEISEGVTQVGPTQTNLFVLATITAFLSTLLIVTIVGYIIYRTITQPLHQLAMLTTRIAKGEIHARADVAGNDEIYQVAASINSMLDSILSLIQETQLQRDFLKSQVEKLLCEVSGVGEGDLRVQAEVTGDALGVLADSFNYMIEELGGLIVRVKGLAAEVEGSAGVVWKHMIQLVETSNKQIERIGTARTEIEHGTTSSRQVSERAKNLYEVARLARQDATTGQDSIRQASAGISRISENVQSTSLKVRTLGEHSREINDIIDTISNIAHQTNRLALDAAIQATMVGEPGKGFGALAADIRRLAERTKDHASMISHIVHGVQEDITEVASSMKDTEQEAVTGLRLTQATGVALTAIFAAVDHQSRETENINQIAAQQLKLCNSVAQIMKEVTESTQHNSQNTQEAAQYMEHLGQLVEKLRASVATFKLREDVSYYMQKPILSSIEMEPIYENLPTVSGIFRRINVTVPAVKTADGWRHPYNFLTPMAGGTSMFTLTPIPGIAHVRPEHRRALGQSKEKWDNVPQSEQQQWSSNKQ